MSTMEKAVSSEQADWRSLNDVLDHYRKQAARTGGMPLNAAAGLLASFLFDAWRTLDVAERAAFASAIVAVETVAGTQADELQRAMRDAGTILELISRRAATKG
jgi:hypothetical protein